VTSLAFAGAGWVTAVHGLAAAGVADLDVTQVASRTPEAADKRARQVGARAATYGDLPGDADAVLVATPPHLHRREAARAVEAGAAALVEAPLASTLADADALVALGEGGGRVAYAENLVHAPPVAEAVRAVRRIGDLTFLEVRMSQGRPDRRNQTQPSWGGGALFGLGCHAVALALLLAAPARVVEVEAQLSATGGMQVDDDAQVTLVFDSRLRAQVRASWRGAAPTWDAQAAAAEGAVRLELVPEPAVEINGVPLPLSPPPSGLASPQLHHLGYAGQLAAFVADVEAGRPPRSGAAFGRAVLEAVCAAYVAAGRGEPEPLPFTGDRTVSPHQLWRRAQQEAHAAETANDA
jgi:predicted dehydrogenase